MNLLLKIIVQLAFSYVSTVGFALCINVPRKGLNCAGLAGMIGWIVYWVIWQAGVSIMIANLVGAFAIGIAGIMFARLMKMPVIVFNIPGLVPLVPGATAYEAVRALVMNHQSEGIELLVRVIMVAGSIAVGFMFAQLVTELTRPRLGFLGTFRSQD
ncbi:threonine/serine exporter family protein [Lacticaseibacillus pabuli]|uniref:Threonine/serine exporter family protein n=1 Tax=Lacticaseibacillus pabuli TaxID=3025672 RepID=A0ABY7WQQ0_9LACO|nr:threonine/serine exporter family protein [Lacticaseibacillus sp. KACC 23028]WDF82513.1 threonine/serine exporter family protein [Lacticaseibacillus sp. KACC 23028]